MTRKENRSHNRRTVLKSIVAAGTVGGFTVGTARGQPADKRLPSTYDRHGTAGDSFEDPAYFRHLADLPVTRQLLDRYERSGDVSQILTPELQRRLRETDRERVDVTVSTTGRPTTLTTDGPFERTLYGWEPTPGELSRLREFGSIRFAPDIASTKVGLSGVDTDDITPLADLPFVLEVGYDPEVRAPTNSVTTASETTADDLRSSSHSDFDSVSHTLDSGLKIGCFNLGYAYGDGGDTTDWSKNWAESQGIDTGLAKDFTGNGTWKEYDHDHGTNVMDTTAYMLEGRTSSSSHHVPLRVYDINDSDIKASEWRNAIEYALKKDIPASVTSLETAANEGYCPSTLCEELDSYTSAGYAMTVATGNDNKESEVCHPATSYHAISVGGYNGSCSGGYSCDGASNYGTIDYYYDPRDIPYCKYCYNSYGDNKFQPDVYSCYEFQTDAGNVIAGTSFASPVVGAGTAIHASANGAISYYDHLLKYHDMNNYVVCPSGSSEEGDVLNVPDLT